MSEEYRRALADGLRVFEAGEYGAHVLANLDSLISLHEARMLQAESWEDYKEDKIKRAAYLRARKILLLESDVD